MTRQENSNLIERAEQLVATIDKWGGVDAVCNRIDLIDEYLQKMDARKNILVQLEKMSGSMYLFKAFLSVDEAAAYLDVTRNTICKLIKFHGLPTYSQSSSKLIILTEELIEWCKQYPTAELCDEAKLGTEKKKGSKK